MIYEYSALTNRHYLEFDELRAILRMASATDIKNRDARPLLFALNRMTEINPRLRGHINTRRAAIRSWDWDVVALEKSDATRADEAKIRLRGCIKAIIEDYINCPLTGAFAVGINWGDGKTQPVSPRRYDVYEIEQYRDGVAFLTASSNGMLSKKFVRFEEKHTGVVFATDGSHAPGGTLKSILPIETLRFKQLREWGNFNEKLKGIIQAIIDGEASDEDRATAVELLKTAAKGNYAVTDELVKFEFNEVASSQGSGSFSEFIKAANDDIAIAILGQANTSQLPASSGSRAALEVMRLISADIAWQDINEIESAINGQLLLYDFWLKYNDTATEARWQFRFKLAEERDIEKEAAAITEIRNAGIPILKKEVYERLGYSAPAAGDEVFGATEAPAASNFPL